MCKIREHIYEHIRNHKIECLYKEIVTNTMLDFVVNTIDELINKKRNEMECYKNDDADCSLIDHEYFKRCELKDLDYEIGRLVRIKQLFETANYEFKC